jgi:hypothetical protein
VRGSFELVASGRHLRSAAFLSGSPCITVLPPPRGPRSICIRAMPSIVFSSMASDVLHTWPCCSRANPPVTVTLQLLPLLLLLLLPDPRLLRSCHVASTHARIACVLGPRLILLRPPAPDYHQVLHARGLAVLVLAYAKPPCQSSTCTFSPARRAAPCPHTRLRAFCSSVCANVASAALWRRLDPERPRRSSACSPHAAPPVRPHHQPPLLPAPLPSRRAAPAPAPAPVEPPEPVPALPAHQRRAAPLAPEPPHREPASLRAPAAAPAPRLRLRAAARGRLPRLRPHARARARRSAALGPTPGHRPTPDRACAPTRS